MASLANAYMDGQKFKHSTSHATMALLLSKNGLRSNLRASNYSWGSMPPDSPTLACLYSHTYKSDIHVTSPGYRPAGPPWTNSHSFKHTRLDNVVDHFQIVGHLKLYGLVVYKIFLEPKIKRGFEWTSPLNPPLPMGLETRRLEMLWLAEWNGHHSMIPHER